MRRSLLAAAIVTALAATPAMAVPAPRDVVTGSGPSSSLCNGTFSVDATSDQGGDNPNGVVTCGAFFHGPVTCLNVSGRVALLTIETVQFGTVSLQITDGGPRPAPDNNSAGPSDGSHVTPAARLSAAPPGADTVEAVVGANCDRPEGGADLQFAGNLVVIDGTALPRSQAECNRGRWQRFGVFATRRDCRRFVESGGNNPPSGRRS